MASGAQAQQNGQDLATQRHQLPIYTARDALLREFKLQDCCVVMGETGSGKTTQVPQYLLEAGFAKKGGGIAVTQPRRVAATSIAQRVAEERGSPLGSEVGYSVRFDDCFSPCTKLKFMTDGMLLREAIRDFKLMRYNVVILDEAHERTVHTDLLFAIVKTAQGERSRQQLRKLRIIVMSATLAAEEFASYFNNAKILYVQGRQFPVQLNYVALPQGDYVSAAITTVLQLHQEQVNEETHQSLGDILVFLTGQQEIESAKSTLQQCTSLFPSDWLDISICPLFAALQSSQQQSVFQPCPQGSRKIILATNIAETSITIPGVRFVVDAGKVKARGYNPRVGMDLLTVQPISKAQARQRTGRAGREATGHCYRLYTQEQFEELPEDTVPEILRCSLSSIILQLLALGITNIMTFDFMAPPPQDSLLRAVEQLYLFGAVEEKIDDEKFNKKGEEERIVKKQKTGRERKRKREEREEEEEDFGLQLTPLGKTLSHFPLEPTLAKAILTSQEFGCSHEVVSVVSMLSVDSVIYTPQNKREAVSAAHKKFVSADGDHAMLLKIYRAYKKNKTNKGWCRENFINLRHMKTVLDIRRQLQELCERVGVTLSSGGSECSERLRQSLLSGLFMNVAEHISEGRYRTLSTRQEVYIHPTSCLFHTKPHPQLVMCTELILTSKCYMRDVSIIEGEWLQKVAPFLHSKMTSGIH